MAWHSFVTFVIELAVSRASLPAHGAAQTPGGARGEDHPLPRLLGAMPDEVTSFMVLHWPRLMEQDSAYADGGARILSGLEDMEAGVQLRAFVSACTRAEPERIVLGGFDFAMRRPPIAEFCARLHVRTRQRIPDPARWTDEKGEAAGLTPVSVDGVEVFRVDGGEEDGGEPASIFHFALASDRLVVIAEDQTEVAAGGIVDRWT